MDDYPPTPLLHLVIERSEPALIQVDLFGAGDLHTSYPIVNPMINPDVSYTTLIQSLHSLSPHIHRCRRFKIFVTDLDVANAFITIPFMAAKQLEELEMASQCDQKSERERIVPFLNEAIFKLVSRFCQLWNAMTGEDSSPIRQTMQVKLGI